MPAKTPKQEVEAIRRHWMKNYNKVCDINCVNFDHKTGKFIHYGGDKDGKPLSKKELDEMARRSNLMDEVLWALFKLDDKPHQSWRRFLQIALREKDHDSIVACILFNEISATPLHLIEHLGEKVRDILREELRKNKRYYDPAYHPYIKDALKQMRDLEFDEDGKSKCDCTRYL